jgi:hypothetical protein
MSKNFKYNTLISDQGPKVGKNHSLHIHKVGFTHHGVAYKKNSKIMISYYNTMDMEP